nr:unnamed protein product [Callosobruchus analis]
MINFGEVDENERFLVFNILCEYIDRISFSFEDLGRSNLVKMHIICKSNEPVIYNPYRMSAHEKEVLDGLLKELLSNGIIRESESSYASPILLVKRKRVTTGCAWILDVLIP